MKKLSVGMVAGLLTISLIQSVAAVDMPASSTMTTSADMSTTSMSGTTYVGGAAMYADKDIVSNVVNAPNLTTLVAAVKAAGLVTVLSGTGPFTVFGPDNAAFAKLPAGTVDTLVKPENKAMLTDILTYHVVAGKYTVADLTDGMKLTTVEGGTLLVMKSGNTVSLKDAQGNIAKIITPDVLQKNGVAHVIDTVLMPPKPEMTAAPVATPVMTAMPVMTSMPAASIMDSNNASMMSHIGLRHVGAALYIRSSAAMAKNIIGRFLRGTDVNVQMKSANGMWCKVDYKNRDAWVACRYLMK
jgi:uncharacterized surface protein with fasciclin (FAS1) repeats